MCSVVVKFVLLFTLLLWFDAFLLCGFRKIKGVKLPLNIYIYIFSFCNRMHLKEQHPGVTPLAPIFHKIKREKAKKKKKNTRKWCFLSISCCCESVMRIENMFPYDAAGILYVKASSKSNSLNPWIMCFLRTNFASISYHDFSYFPIPTFFSLLSFIHSFIIFFFFCV